jgi:uncharacterized protein
MFRWIVDMEGNEGGKGLRPMTGDGASGNGTATLEAARAHARRQAGQRAATGATIPATSARDLPEGVGAPSVLWDETIGLGSYAHRVLPRDAIVRFTDLDGDACLHLVVWNAAQPAERINVADTVKVQWQAYLGPGALLLSGQGRVLMTIVADTSERHDALCGASTRRRNEERYGTEAGTVGGAGGGRGLGLGGPVPSTRDLLAVAAAKRGLQRRELPCGVNLFKGVRVADDGGLHFDGERRADRWVELRAELDVLVAVANAPHPLDPRPEYQGSTVRATAWSAPRPPGDPFRASSPERLRAFENTDDHLLERPPSAPPAEWAP